MKNLLKAAVTLASLLLSASVAGHTLNFNPSWKFIKQDVVDGQAIDLDDSDWETVSAPHTFNDIDTFDDWSELGHVGERNQWSGRTWYRKHFVTQSEWQDKRVYIEFEAVRQLAEVYLNGQLLGTSENGFLPFGFDLTPHLNPDGNNVLALMVDNRFVADEEGKGTKWHVYEGGARLPWNNPHWHPAHGGIYRNVKLHIKSPQHLTLPIYDNLGTVGTYTYAIKPSRENTTVGIEPQIHNTANHPINLTLVSTVKDEDGASVLSLSQDVSLDSGEKKIVTLRGQLDMPRLWEPASPHVYQVTTKLFHGGRLIDSDQQPLGIRWMTFNPHTGFYINDRYVKLKGWGQKSTNEWPGLGAAQPDWMHYYTMELMQQANGNMVRWGHTAGAKVSLVASDHLGILTLQPGVDGEQDVEGHAWDVRSAAFRDMIIYFRNHPSIIVWEGGNRRVSEEHVKELTAWVEKYDPYGGRGYGHRSPDRVVAKYSDVSITMEGGGFRQNMTPIEGEYNREESPRRVWDRQTPPYENWHASGSYDLTAEQFALNQVWQWDKVSHRSHGGGANWIFSDSTSGGRVNTEVARTSGEVDGVRLPKEAFYTSRVIFADEPDLHLLGHWNYPLGTSKTQYVVANVEEVELIINGQSLGKKPRTLGTDVLNNQHPMIFAWPDVDFVPGEVVALGYNDGKVVSQMRKLTTGEAVELRLTPMTSPKGLLANGSDVVLFDVEALDAKQNRVPTWNEQVNFSVSGPGIWRGGYNSGKIDSINHLYLDLESGINRVAIRSTQIPGEITLTAKAQGIESASITIASLPAEIDNGISSYPPIIPVPQPTVRQSPPGAEDFEMARRTKPLEAQKVDGIVTNLTYTGPSQAGADIVRPIAGQAAYSDYPNPFQAVHPSIAHAEQIRLPFHDWDYWAADVVGFVINQDAWVYVAHPDTVPTPAWLTADYQLVDGQYSLNEGNENFYLYRKRFDKHSDVLIPSNLDVTAEEINKISNKRQHYRMMMVFVVPIE
ncbi:glycoside hydrolase family 2 protein [Vibrio sp. WXL103]|uniref:glycoside hydrolase family 2 protein n=1 Tax=Vibrio sp. WXL103 TaxID=3450710 RepID=UPI003EC8CEA0